MSAFRTDIEIEGLAELSRLWQQAPAIVEEELHRATLEGEKLLEREVKERTPKGVGGAGGGLRGSISAREPRVLADEVIGVVGTSFAHAVPVELGTKPHFPPVAPLADWAHAKLGVPQAEARGVGYVIARAIARRGTEGAHMFERAFEDNAGQVRAMYARALARVRGWLARA